MHLSAITHRPAPNGRPGCEDQGPDGFVCTRPEFHSGLHVAHVSKPVHAIAAIWDGDRTTDGAP